MSPRLRPTRAYFRITTCAAAAVVLLMILAVGALSAKAQTGGERKWLETAAPASAAAGKRVALVVGNTHYGGANALKNPENDARAVAHTLQTLGFDVLMCLDRTNTQMADDIDEFGTKAVSANVALFYFSGHGAQLAGENYLIPVGFDGHNENAIKYQAVNAGRVLDVLQGAKAHVNIVILDACRDNPFADATKSLSRGLASITAPGGTLICYATAPGKTAEDNPDGANGLYTQELLTQMKVPGQRIEDVFINTRVAVLEKSHEKQEPWEQGSLRERFYFSSPASDAAPAAPAAVVVSPTATLLDTSAHLTVNVVNAPNATVLLDGKPITAGQEASLDLGLDKTRQVEIGIAASGYQAVRQNVLLTAGAHATLPITLTALPTSAGVIKPARILLKSVTFDAQTGVALLVGDKLTIRAEGQSGGTAIFSIGGGLISGKMVEISLGIYSGEYRVQNGDSAVNAPVTVTLTSQFASKTETLEAAQKVTLGVLPPPNLERPTPTGPITAGGSGGGTKINEKDGAAMVFVPAGPFLMGDDDDAIVDYTNVRNNPRHTVTLSGYYIYKNLVTVAMYRKYCAATGKSMPSPPSWGWQDDHPIVNVSWDDAKAYCD